MKYKITIEAEVTFSDPVQLMAKVQYVINRISFNLGWWGRDDPRIASAPRIVRFEEVAGMEVRDGKL